MRHNLFPTAMFALSVLLLLLANTVQCLRHPPTASAQSSGRWKVMVITPGENGAKQLEEVLNSDIWRQATLYTPNTPGSAIAILSK